MNILNAYSRFLNALTKILKAVVCFLLAAMVLIMFYQAMMRYVFSNAQPWCEELTLYIGIFNVMLGLGIASRMDSHLQVDFLTRLYGPTLRCLMTAVWAIVSIVIMIVFAYYAVSLIGKATARSVTLPITMAHVYTAFPIGAAILVIYSIEIAARNIVGFLHGGVMPALPGEEKGGEQA